MDIMKMIAKIILVASGTTVAVWAAGVITLICLSV
jgi:hypothetical protein